MRDAPDLSAPADYPNHTLEQVLAHIAATAASDSLVAFSSQARVEIRSPQRDAELSATIRQRASDTLWASARGPLSIEVARARATPDSVQVLDKFNGRLYIGSMAAATAFLPAPLTTRDLFATLLGTYGPAADRTWLLSAPTRPSEEPYYTLTDPTGHITFTVDPATWRTVRYRSFTDGTLIDERTFSAFDMIDGRVLPRRIELRNPSADTKLTIEHRKLTLNPPTLDFPFSPGDAEVRRLN